MNLVKGELLGADALPEVMESLPAQLAAALARPRLEPDRVLDACDTLVRSLDTSRYLGLMRAFGIDEALGLSYIERAKQMFCRESLEYRLRMEFGESMLRPRVLAPPFYTGVVKEEIMPLGVLLHIAAGNVDALPAFSVLEGLITGNINILKLPSEEGGASAMILKELIKAEPLLADYIYVLEYSSRDIEALERLAELSDAVVVWGGDEAVRAARRIAKPNTRVIEWGHNLSFVYISSEDVSDAELMGLARHVCETNQLLCSSCQGIYIDTDNMEAVYAFCRRFIKILEAACAEKPADPGISIESNITLLRRTRALESIFDGNRVFEGGGCSLVACGDCGLQPSMQFRNLWVKRLPREEIAGTLRRHKNHLNTVGLICGDGDRSSLAEVFFRIGCTRVTGTENMSRAYIGAAHDGEAPLRSYTKTVSQEY